MRSPRTRRARRFNWYLYPSGNSGAVVRRAGPFGPAAEAGSERTRPTGRYTEVETAIGARQGRHSQGGCADHGTYQGGHDDERLHPGTRRATRLAADRVGAELFRVVQIPEG